MLILLWVGSIDSGFRFGFLQKKLCGLREPFFVDLKAFLKGVLRKGMFFERYLTVITRWLSAFSRFLAALISVLKNTPHSRNLFLAGPIFGCSAGELSNETHVKDNDDSGHRRDGGHQDGMIPVKVIRFRDSLIPVLAQWT
jgi:hypothetical protein